MVAASRLATCPPSDFAAAVHRAVATVGHAPTERFGTRKVFLSAVWAALRPTDWLTAAMWPRQLFNAHRLGLIRLARADLVAAMPAAAVAASQIRVNDCEYHFIIDPEAV
jgi:hypothetical protein